MSGEESAEFANAWNASYQRRENWLFHPSEALVRLINTNLLDQAQADIPGTTRLPFEGLQALDVGCGLGRHVHYLEELGFEAVGVDISAEAIRKAREWYQLRAGKTESSKFQVVRPPFTWPPSTVDLVVCASVLDSMPLEDARHTTEVAFHALRPGGYFYFDVVVQTNRVIGIPRQDKNQEFLVIGDHEKGTVQTLFSEKSILSLLPPGARLVASESVTRDDLVHGWSSTRRHLLVQRPVQ